MSRPPITSASITFLGTASAQPSSTRNHSSLALRLGGDVWLFDCGEATQHQLQRSTVKLGKVEKIFITHTHGDHIFGLIPVLASRLNGAGGTVDDADDPRHQVDHQMPPLEIYGPYGTRAYVRSGLLYTHTLLSAPYVVHELRTPSDPPGDNISLPLHSAELPSGRDILQSEDQPLWTDIYKDAVVSVSAAPIFHSVPCIDPKQYAPELKRTGAPMTLMRQLQQGESVQLPDGTILHGPPRRPGRKIVILGDTYDASPIIPLAKDADILIHEATNAHLPDVDSHTKATDTYESVEERAKSRGHSTPQVAGAFATRTRARKLLLNHFSARYPGDDDCNEWSKKVMDAIKSLAATEYEGEIVCARDFMTIDCKLPILD
ncbi:hypothetical protein PLEOSDRAFT_1103337 [Pleurotus ostreatus PC15]|uniref:Uncharacterized protein n=1 Tax=Pleurotus ostreatus (strain PC15) TaxID=1137138 RepID=A0A067NN45_PLEO1|nr:hypothetical protein PLEOSDRAFT_1103337 [Pleurotus ostreatus PC15]